ncbi:MAG: peptidoglycan-binding protein [Clostridia bacterium]|nr:peptidoglycan-binding protein [Clostridia bacterium]
MKRMICAALIAALTSFACAALGEGLLGVTISYTPAPTSAPTAVPASPAPSVTPVAPVTQEEAQNAALGERILMRGMAGEDVEIVQRRLHELGYYLDEIDGVYGLKTRSAVYAFQRAHKMEKVDGKVGPQTIGMLFSDHAIIKPTPTPTPTPTPRPTPTPTPTPVPTPVPTPTPDVQGAPFALESVSLFVADLPLQLMLGRVEDEWLYPLCGVMSHMGFEHAYEAGSWQLSGKYSGIQIALMTAGVEGLNPGAMGLYDGVVFLTGDDARVYAYGDEAYVTEALLEMLGVNVLLVGGTPVIH